MTPQEAVIKSNELKRRAYETNPRTGFRYAPATTTPAVNTGIVSDKDLIDRNTLTSSALQTSANNVNKYGQDILSMINREPVERQSAVEKIRNEQGYYDKINAFNNSQKTLMEAEALLDQLPQNVKTRTTGRLMTNNQVDRIKAKETQELAESLGKMARASELQRVGLDDINTMVNEILTTRQSDQEMKLRALGLMKDDAMDFYKMDRSTAERLEDRGFNAGREDTKLGKEYDWKQLLLDWEKEQFNKQLDEAGKDRAVRASSGGGSGSSSVDYGPLLALLDSMSGGNKESVSQELAKKVNFGKITDSLRNLKFSF